MMMITKVPSLNFKNYHLLNCYMLGKNKKNYNNLRKEWNLPASEMREHLRPAPVLWSTKSYLCSDWRGIRKWVVIFKCDPLLSKRGWWNWLARLVTVHGELSEMHISLKKACTDFFLSLYACGSTRDPKQHPKSQEKSFHNMSPLKKMLKSVPYR